MKDTANSFGANLKALRKKAGLTQEELAFRVGLTARTIVRWETNNSVPDLDDIKRLAEALHVSEQQLLSPDREASRWVLSIKVVPDFKEEVIDLSKGTPNISNLNIAKDGAVLTLSAPFEMWTNEDNLEDIMQQLKEAAKLVILNGKRMGNIKN